MEQTNQKNPKNNPLPRNHNTKRNLQTQTPKNNTPHPNNQNIRIRQHPTRLQPLKRPPNRHNKPTPQKRTPSPHNNTSHKPHPHPPNPNHLPKHPPLNQTPRQPHPQKHHPNPPNPRRNDRRNLRPLRHTHPKRRHVLLRPNIHTLLQQKTPPSRTRLQPKLGNNKPNKNRAGLLHPHLAARRH